MSNCRSYNRSSVEPYIDFGFQKSSTCIKQMEEQKNAYEKYIADSKTAYEKKIDELKKKLDDKNEQIIFTSTTCTKNRELQNQEYEKEIAKLNGEIDSLKKACNETKNIFENKIIDFEARQSGYQSQIKDFESRKAAYCQVSKPENFRFYY